MFPKMNWNLLPMKGHFLFFNAATAPVIPFLPVMARQLGFSGTIVGLIYTVLPIAGMIAKPVLGGIADKYKCKKLLFILLQIFMAISLFGINSISEIPRQAKVHFACDAGESVFDTSPQNRSIQDKCAKDRILESMGDRLVLRCHMECNALTEEEYKIMCAHWEHGLHYCQTDGHHLENFQFTALVPKEKIEVFDDIIVFKVINISLNDGSTVKPICPEKTQRISTECNMDCNSHAVNTIVSVRRSEEYDVLGEYQFWLFATLAVLGWGCMAVVVSIGDAICFEMLGDQPNLYGYQRLWGSIGWGTFSILAGFMVDSYSDGQAYKDYTSVFYLMIVMVIIDVITSSQLRYKQEHISPNIIRDVAQVILRIRVAVYLLWCVFVGACTGLIWNFLFWHIEDMAAQYDDAGGDCNMHEWIKTLEGIVMGIECLGGELPFFFLSSWILKHFGHVNCMSIVLLCIGIRYSIYSVLVNPWFILPVELIHGITFGLFYATMASYASIVAPPGTEATVQGLVGAVFEGIGVSIGSLLGGVFFDLYGGWITFRIFGIASLLCCVLHVLIQYYLARQARRNGGHEPDQDITTRYVPPKEVIRILKNGSQEFTLVDH